MKYVAIYSNAYSDYEAVGPFDTDEEANKYLDSLVKRDKIREKDTVGTARLRKP